MVRLIKYAGWLTVLALLLASAPADAGLKKLGIAGFGFLKVTQSPRVAAMGDAFTAVADGIDGMFTNPAGITGVERFGYSFSHTRWLVDSKFYSGAVVYRIGNSAIGLNVISYRPTAFEETTIFKPDGTGLIVDDGDIAIGGTYAIKLTDKLSFGAQMRYIQEALYTDRNKSFDFALGTTFYTGFRSIRIAMALRNFGKDNVIILDQAFMPLIYNIGLAMEIYGEKGDPVSFTVAADNVFYIDYEGRFHLGGELWLANTLALRGGYKFNYDTETFCLGAGLKTSLGRREFTADFSYTEMGDLFDPALRFSVGGSF